MTAGEFKTMAKQALGGAINTSGVTAGTTMSQLSTDPRFIDKLSQSIGNQTAAAFKKHGMAPAAVKTTIPAPATPTTQTQAAPQPPAQTTTTTPPPPPPKVK
jgi:hypothetical protein